MRDMQGVVGDDTFREGVVSGFLLILFSELGDKTFFIALLLALKQSQALVFAGTFGALTVMTVVSVGPAVSARPLTAACLWPVQAGVGLWRLPA